MNRSLMCAAAIAVAAATPALAQTDIQLWHAMGGKLGERTVELFEGFNKSQRDYKVTAVFKGNYTELMTGAIAAFRANQHPHIIQVFEVGTATMMSAKGAVYPVYQLMADAKEPFEPKNYLAAVTGYYTTPDGKMLSMPFNSSTPVMYYNKDAFQKAGLDPAKPPRTWPELEAAAKKILAAGGAKCGFTTAWPSWLHIENLSSLHNVPIGTKSNGFEGLDTEFRINSPLHVKHVGMLAEWQKSKVFDYGGRRSDSAPKFYSGECAMYMNSSAAYADVSTNSKFAWGIAMLPYWPEVQGAPQNSIIGGATLWVLSKKSPAEYKGIAKLFSYMSRAEVQAKWHQETGYLPVTLAAYELSKKQGFYDKNPGTDTSILQLNLNPPTANSKGLRFGNFVQIRDIFDEELEAAFAGKKTAKVALDSAVKRGNDLLRRFEDANK